MKPYNIAPSLLGNSCLGAVKIDSLIPVQQVKSAAKILRSADVYQQKFLKFKTVGIFHSYAEYLHAALLESNTDVNKFVPQPYSFRIGKRRYIPDCYYQELGKRYVVEIKPRGEFDEDLSIPLTQYLEFHNISFRVISNESILEQEILGLNWIQIVQTLVSAGFEDTELDEHRIWQKLSLSPQLTIGDIVDHGDRIRNRQREIALFRLAHAGKLHLDLERKVISYDTEVLACN